MIVRVGWITVPRAERMTSGCCFLVAALGGAGESRNDKGCYKANDNCTHGASLVLRAM